MQTPPATSVLLAYSTSSNRSYNDCVHSATSLAPKELHMGRIPRLPLTIFGRDNMGATENFPAVKSNTTYFVTGSSGLRPSSLSSPNLCCISRASVHLTAALTRHHLWQVGDWCGSLLQRVHRFPRLFRPSRRPFPHKTSSPVEQERTKYWS